MENLQILLQRKSCPIYFSFVESRWHFHFVTQSFLSIELKSYFDWTVFTNICSFAVASDIHLIDKYKRNAFWELMFITQWLSHKNEAWSKFLSLNIRILPLWITPVIFDTNTFFWKK